MHVDEHNQLVILSSLLIEVMIVLYCLKIQTCNTLKKQQPARNRSWPRNEKNMQMQIKTKPYVQN